MAIEMVGMTHKDLPGSVAGPVPRHAAESYWVPVKGWEIVEPEVAAASIVLGAPVTDLDKLKREQLDEVARGITLDPSQYTSKGDLIDAIRQHYAVS